MGVGGSYQFWTQIEHQKPSQDFTQGLVFSAIKNVLDTATVTADTAQMKPLKSVVQEIKAGFN